MGAMVAGSGGAAIGSVPGITARAKKNSARNKCKKALQQAGTWSVGARECFHCRVVPLRLHHCKNCGQEFCKTCRQYEGTVVVKEKPYRVSICIECFHGTAV